MAEPVSTHDAVVVEAEADSVPVVMYGGRLQPAAEVEVEVGTVVIDGGPSLVQ